MAMDPIEKQTTEQLPHKPFSFANHGARGDKEWWEASSSDEETKQERAAAEKAAAKQAELHDLHRRLVGALAMDIRGDWGDFIKPRLQLITEYWGYHFSHEEQQDIHDDGRWFRDEWTGPYGGQVTAAELASLGLEEDIFNHPECYVVKQRDN